MLHLQWRLHEELFVKQERRKLLDEVAGTFFALVQQNFLLEVQLAIARLGDPAQQGPNSNMTLHKLAAEIGAVYQEPLDLPVKHFLAALTSELATFAMTSEKVRERRNKYLAHSDYDHALGKHPVPILTPTRAEIDGALATLRSALHLVTTHFGEIPTAYQAVNAEGTGESLVGMIKAGMRYYELLDEGTLDGDLHLSKWGNA
jgi:hypothetical protein